MPEEKEMTGEISYVGGCCQKYLKSRVCLKHGKDIFFCQGDQWTPWKQAPCAEYSLYPTDMIDIIIDERTLLKGTLSITEHFIYS